MISLKSPRNQKLTFRGFWCERFSRKSIYKLVLCPHNDRIVSNVLAISQSSQKQTKFIFLSNDFLLVMVKFMRVHSTVHFVYVCYTPLPRPLRSEQSEGVLLGESGESPPVRCPEPSRSNFPACTLKRSNSFDSMLNCSLWARHRSSNSLTFAWAEKQTEETEQATETDKESERYRESDR